MKTENEIDCLNEVIACFEHEIKIKDELIKKQNAMIETLEEYNAKLKQLLEEVLSSSQKG